MEGALGGSQRAMEECGQAVVDHPDDTVDVGAEIALLVAALRGPHVGFEIPVALDAPVVVGEFVDQHFFGEGGGLMFGAQIFAEGI